jgi:hypothetical protein
MRAATALVFGCSPAVASKQIPLMSQPHAITVFSVARRLRYHLLKPAAWPNSADLVWSWFTLATIHATRHGFCPSQRDAADFPALSVDYQGEIRLGR